MARLRTAPANYWTAYTGKGGRVWTISPRLPVAFRQQLREAGYTPGLPRIEKKFVSADGTVRYLLGFADGQSVETVWMPEGDGGEAGDGSADGDAELQRLLRGHSERTTGSRRAACEEAWHRATICVSSQVGCAVECAFCMTALLGPETQSQRGRDRRTDSRRLNDQQVELERDRVNLVFMGQGEPFLNYDNFMQAVRLLVEAVGIPESRMTVSTSGIVPRIADFGAEPVRPKLAVSLNAPNEALRAEIMPITKKWTIEKLIAALREFPLRNRERLTFEYVLLGGVNDDLAACARDGRPDSRSARQGQPDRAESRAGDSLLHAVRRARAGVSKCAGTGRNSGVCPASSRSRHLRRLWPAQTHHRTGTVGESERPTLTERLYYTDSFLSDFDACVVVIEGNAIQLDRSAFYPTSGGQIFDTGWLEVPASARCA